MWGSLCVRSESLAGAPVLVVHRGSAEDARGRGVVLFFHGLGGSKEVHQRELILFAQKGLFAVGVDAVGHGARRYPDFEDRFSRANPRLEHEFTGVIRSTASEVPALCDALAAQHGKAPLQMAIGGASLGGFITYAAILEERRLCAAVPFVASPRWTVPLPGSPHLHPDRFSPVALFSQTAGLDAVVPAKQVRELHAQLKPFYALTPDRLRHREFPRSEHMMRPEDWEEATKDAAEWLAHFLS